MHPGKIANDAADVRSCGIHDDALAGPEVGHEKPVAVSVEAGVIEARRVAGQSQIRHRANGQVSRLADLTAGRDNDGQDQEEPNRP